MTTIRTLIHRSVLAVILNSTTIAYAASFTSWSKTMPITFAGYGRNETLSNFPALVILPGGRNGVNYADFQAGGADLRFAAADETTELNYEIEQWNTNCLSSPANVPGLQLWLKADDGALTNASGVVTNWLDRSGLGRHTVSVGSPTLVSDAFNGKPAIRFGAGTNYFSSVALDSSNNCLHMFLVVKAGAKGLYHNLYERTGIADPMLWVDTGNHYEMNGGGGAGKKITSSALVGSLQIVHAAMSNGVTALYVNGVSQGTGTDTAPASALYTLFNRTAGSSYTGDVAEVLSYSNNLTSTQQQLIGGYLADKYSVPGTPYPTGKSYVWVRVPALSSSNDVIHAYWGKPGEAAPACATNGSTWDTTYAGVWHLSGTNGTLSPDATAYRHDGTNYNMPAQPWTLGAVADGLSFDGANDYVTGMGYGLVPQGQSNYTVSTWFKRAANNGNREMISQWYYSGNDFYLGFNGDTVRFSDNWNSVAVGLTLDANWHHLAAVSTTNNAYLYLDGTLKATKGSALTYTGLRDLWFGRQGAYSGGAEWFSGAMDQVEIARVNRSSNWVWAAWLNQASNSAFLAYGTVGAATTALTTRAAAVASVTTNSAVIGGAVLHAGNAENPWAYVCWDNTDRGTNAPTDWLHVEALGTNWGVGETFSITINGLIAGSNYVYRSYVTNSSGRDWSDTAVTFAVPFAMLVQGRPANYGSPLPYGYGTNLIPPGTTVTNAVSSPADASSTLRRACVGWNAALLSDGSPVGSGATTQAVVQVTNHLALTWNWTNEWCLTLANSVGGTNEAKAGWYTEGTTVSVSAFPTGAYHFVGWSGNLPAGAATNNPITVTLDQARTLQSQFSASFSNFTLLVTGSPGNYGLPAPLNYGTYRTNILDGSWITNSVRTPTNATAALRRACLGWRLAYTNGTYLAGDVTTQAVFQLDASKQLTWLWTNEYYLSVSAATGGTASTAVSGWYTNGLQATLSATPDGGFSFLRWLGGVPAGSETGNPILVTMDQPRETVALFVPNAATETKVWNGSGRWSSGTNWSGGVAPGPEDDVIIRSGTNVLAGAVQVNSLIISNNAALIFTNWNSLLAVTRDVTIAAGGRITLPPAFTDLVPSNNIYITCRHFTIETGGVIDADKKGYAGGSYRMGYGPGASAVTDRDGAAHGGRGANYNGGLNGTVYDTPEAPLCPGSGGGGNYGTTGGAGGGAVRIHASGAMLLNGSILASAGNGNVNDSGSGSGGSIYLTCSTLAGSNAILAADGTGAPQGNGGGGRIAVYCDSTAQSALPHPSISLSVRRGTGNANWAEFGTLYLSDFGLFPREGANCNGPISGPTNWVWNDDRLTLSNCWLSWPGAARMSISNSMALIGTTLTLTNLNLTVGGDLVLTNPTTTVASWNLVCGPTNGTGSNYGARISVGGTLSMSSNVTWSLSSDPTNGGSAYVTVGALRMDQGSLIDAAGKGYAGGAGGNGWGPGGGTNATGGGGYGGRGGDAVKGGGAYGSSNAPVDPGSGGGGSNGGRGGGLVRIEATGTATLNGIINANGSNGVTAGSGGSGGGIFLTALAFPPASGTLTANGGNGATASYGGGGGGRIALVSQSDGFAGTLSVTNGGSGTYTGDVGTVVRRLVGSGFNLNIEGDPARHGTLNSPYIYGNNGVASGETVTNNATTPADAANGQRFVCLGWNLSNTVGTVGSGTDTQAVFTVTTNLFLVWHWTNQFYLAATANTNGNLTPDRTGWYTNGAPVAIQASADTGFSFLQWSGDGVPAGQHTVNPLTVTLDRPRTITAQFAVTNPPAARTWTGVGDWWSATNWTPSGVPGRGETVAVAAGTVTVRDPITVANVTVSNTGTLRLETTGELTVASSLLVTGASAVVYATNVSLTVSNSLTIANGGKFYACGGLVSNPTNASCTVTVAGTLLVQTNGFVYPTSHPTNGGSVCFRVGYLTVDSGGRIDADSRGFAGLYGPGVGSGRGGGGHGGRGGDIGAELGGSLYGDSNTPVRAGSGSGYGYQGATRPGGGVIWVQADRIVTVNGVLTANGSGADHDKGAGAGGSIYIRCARFAGTGTCEARGGDTSGTSGGGGGGRIAVYRESHTFTGTLSTNSVRGGTHTTVPTAYGQYGTLVLVQVPRAGTIYTVR